MQLTLKRFKDNKDATIGTLEIDGTPMCFTLEDAYQEEKIYGKTRIPMGHYEIKLRNEGGMTQKYAQRYDFHKGMLWLQNVFDFEWVYIHTGNDEDHTDGCILVGNSANLENTTVGSSRNAYTELYPIVASAIENGIKVTIQVIDEG